MSKSPIKLFDIQEYTYDGFIKKYLEVLKVFDEIVEVSAFTRFGLRYVNSIPEKKMYHGRL